VNATAGRTIANEFAKMRHLRVSLLAAALLLALVAVSLYAGVLSLEFVPGEPAAWTSLLYGTANAYPLAAPLLLSVLASRQVDIEHQGGGWMLQATAGVTRGRLCRAKFAALGLVLTVVTAASGLLVVSVGLLAGAPSAVPVGTVTGTLAAVLVVSLSLLALHILLAALVENQLVGVGVGLLGTVVALFGSAVPAWLAHLTPWGYYALMAPAEYAGETLVPVTPAYASAAGLGIVVAAAFLLVTGRFDREES
jgi:hypothetical protein